MTDSWQHDMQQANEKWLKKKEAEYPFRISIARASAPSLQDTNRLRLAFIFAPLPEDQMMVFGFTSQDDLATFKKEFKLND